MRSIDCRLFFFAFVLLILVSLFLIYSRSRYACDVELSQVSVFPPQQVSINSTCRVLNITVDGEPVQFAQTQVGSYFLVDFDSNLTKGKHLVHVFVEGKHEPEAYPILAKVKECEAGETRDCLTHDGCDGTQRCVDYEWTPCKKNRMVCRPGQRKACAYTPCKVGHKECNECGTGYGPCLPG